MKMKIRFVVYPDRPGGGLDFRSLDKRTSELLRRATYYIHPVDIYAYDKSKIKSFFEKYRFDSSVLCYNHTIPHGTTWNGATIPRLAWSILGYYPHGIMSEPSLLHDDLYVNEGSSDITKFSRKEVDQVFYSHMLYVGVKPISAKIMYKCVRAFGWVYWFDNALYQSFKRLFRKKPSKK